MQGSEIHRTLIGKAEGKKSTARHRRRWEDNTEIYIKEIWVEA
jgi:hypothetical protein